MVRRNRSLLAALVASSAFVFGMLPANAASVPYEHIGTQNQPNIDTGANFRSFDISWVNNQNDRYYLADRSTNALDQLDADDGSQASIPYLGLASGCNPITATTLGSACNFSGNFNDPANPAFACAQAPRDDRNGPNGVWTDDRNVVWAGDGNHATGACTGGVVPTGTSHLQAYDPDTGAQLANIDTGGLRRSDEGCFGRARPGPSFNGSGQVDLSTLGNRGGGVTMVANPAEADVPGHFPFVTLVNSDSKTILGKIVYDVADPNAPLPPGHGYLDAGPAAGIEQCVWDPIHNVFLVNIDTTVRNPDGEIDVISPSAAGGAGRILDIVPMPGCGGPTGLAIWPGVTVMAECGDGTRLLSASNLHDLVQTFPETAGADEIWFNPGDLHLYLGITSKGLGIVNVASRSLEGIVPALTPSGLNLGTHSVSASARNNLVQLPTNEFSGAVRTGAGGIGLYRHDDGD